MIGVATYIFTTGKGAQRLSPMLGSLLEKIVAAEYIGELMALGVLIQMEPLCVFLQEIATDYDDVKKIPFPFVGESADALTIHREHGREKICRMSLIDSLAEIEPLYYGSIERIVIEVSHQYCLTPGVLSEE